jgi:hypothetical protein
VPHPRCWCWYWVLAQTGTGTRAKYAIRDNTQHATRATRDARRAADWPGHAHRPISHGALHIACRRMSIANCFFRGYSHSEPGARRTDGGRRAPIFFCRPPAGPAVFFWGCCRLATGHYLLCRTVDIPNVLLPDGPWSTTQSVVCGPCARASTCRAAVWPSR